MWSSSSVSIDTKSTCPLYSYTKENNYWFYTNWWFISSENNFLRKKIEFIRGKRFFLSPKFRFRENLFSCQENINSTTVFFSFLRGCSYYISHTSIFYQYLSKTRYRYMCRHLTYKKIMHQHISLHVYAPCRCVDTCVGSVSDRHGFFCILSWSNTVVWLPHLHETGFIEKLKTQFEREFILKYFYSTFIFWSLMIIT